MALSLRVGLKEPLLHNPRHLEPKAYNIAKCESEGMPRDVNRVQQVLAWLLQTAL